MLSFWDWFPYPPSWIVTELINFHSYDKDDNCRLLLLWLSVEVGGADTTTNCRQERCRQVGGGLQKGQRGGQASRRRMMTTTRRRIALLPPSPPPPPAPLPPLPLLPPPPPPPPSPPQQLRWWPRKWPAKQQCPLSPPSHSLWSASTTTDIVFFVPVIFTTFVARTVLRTWSYPVYVIVISCTYYARLALGDNALWCPTVISIIAIATSTLPCGKTSTNILLPLLCPPHAGI